MKTNGDAGGISIFCLVVLLFRLFTAVLDGVYENIDGVSETAESHSGESCDTKAHGA